MPNIDVNTYFFTAVVPVCNEGIVERGGMKSSPVHVVREVLETVNAVLGTKPRTDEAPAPAQPDNSPATPDA